MSCRYRVTEVTEASKSGHTQSTLSMATVTNSNPVPSELPELLNSSTGHLTQKTALRHTKSRL